MRPIRLEMTAFGSYKDKSVVEFNRISGLFLITGDTGAGKTTIFDAIVFALYGQLSGTNKEDRKPEMMHCDKVPKSQDTEVNFEFMQNGKKYIVNRTIHFPKSRGKDNQYGKASFSAVLYEPDGNTLSVATQIDKRCEEIVGFDRTQFCQVIMLAQGEFQKFLKADSKDRGNILGKLFDNSSYLRYQEYFKMAAGKLEAERSEEILSIENQMINVFKIPEDAEDAEREKYIPGSPSLESNISELLQKEENYRKIHEKLFNDAKEEREKLNISRGKAESDNKSIEALNLNESRLSKLESEKDEIENAKLVKEKVNKIRFIIYPEKEKADKAVIDLDNNRKKIEELKIKAEKSKMAVEKAEMEMSKDGELKAKSQSLSVQISKIEETLGDYEKFDKNILEYKKCNAKLEKLRKDTDKLKISISSANDNIIKWEAEKENLKDAENEKNRLENELKDLKSKVESLNEIKKKIDKITDEEAEYAICEQKLSKTMIEAKKLGDEFNELNKKFINGYASLLGINLKSEIQKKGEAFCPVCRTHLTKIEDLKVEQASNNIVTKDMVDDSRKIVDEKNQQWQMQSENLTRQKTQIENSKLVITELAVRVGLNITEYNEIINDSLIDKELEAVKANGREKNTRYKDAKKSVDRKNELENILKNARAEIDSFQKSLDINKNEISKKENEAGRLETEIKNLRDNLKFESKAQAENIIEEMNTEKKRADDTIKSHDEDLKKARELMSEVLGNINSHKDATESLKKEVDKTQNSLLVTLSENGFASWDEANLYLTKVGTDVSLAEKWMRSEEKRISDFNSEYDGIKNTVSQLRDQTKDIIYSDLSEIDIKIQESTNKCNEINDFLNTTNNRIENHREVLKKIKKSFSVLKDTDASYKLIKKLSDLCNGSNGEGGQLTFDRYVMGTIFHEIVDRSNMRLDGMSGGRYSLKHIVEAKRVNGKAGLELRVLDRESGVEREAASLSGGETFLVSMSLALGLSDTVRNHAGGKEIDALFIDEGFGSLDDNKLDGAIEVLKQLTNGNGMVGIISHVDKLKAGISKKLIIHQTENGSVIEHEGFES